MTKRLRTTFLHNKIIITAYNAPNIPAHKLRCAHHGGHSTPAQRRYNRKKSIEKIVLKGLNSFTAGCFHIVYTYNDDSLPADVNTAYKDMVNTFRCTKRLYIKHDISCSYIGSVERGEQNGRLHCHALFPYSRGIDIEEIKSKWKKGTVIVRFIPVIQVEEIVKYVLKNPLRKVISRNFKMPRIKVKDITECEFKQLIYNPISVEESLSGFIVCDIEEKQFAGWTGNFNKIKIQLREIKVDNHTNNKLHFYKRRDNSLNTS